MLTPKELESRKWTIGSSDVPAICGLSPWATPGNVLERKLAGLNEEEPQHRLGHKLERPIAELAWREGKLGLAVALLDGRTVTKDWMSATPDFWALKTGNETSWRSRPLPEDEALLVEVKNVGWRVLPHWEWGKVVPDYVTAQCQWQMKVLGHSKVCVAALIGGASVETYVIERDDVMIDRLKKQCREFWERHMAPGKRDKVWARVALEKLRARTTRRKTS